MFNTTKAYLTLYNALQLIGWTAALYKVTRTADLLPNSSAYRSAAPAVSKPGSTQRSAQRRRSVRRVRMLVRIFWAQIWQHYSCLAGLCQGAAILETLHAIIGLVKGSPATAFLQWFGRSNVLFAILSYVPEAQKGWPVPMLFGAWAISEVIRYPWYIFAQFREPPSFLTWLRYTMFIPLYPVGVASEVVIILRSLPALKHEKLHSIELPNWYNFSFNYYGFCLFALWVLYPLGFPWLFKGLLQQRRRRLSQPRQKTKPI